MTHGDSAFTPSEIRTRDAVQGLPPPVADPAFRARAKRDFLAGAAGPRRVIAPRPTWRPAWWVVVPAAAALAAIVLVALPRGPSWRVVAVEGGGVVVVDQRPIPVEHTADLVRSLKPGARVGVGPETTLELDLRGVMALQAVPGTEFTLPGAAPGWGRRDLRAKVETGEVRLTTGPAFVGDRLRIETPEASVLVAGTTLAVIRDSLGTCVCVCEGSVDVGPRGGPMERVVRDRRRFVFRDRRPPENAAIREIEGVELVSLRNRHRARLEGSR